MTSSKPIRVLVIGQTPPPWGGQTRALQQLVHAPFSDIRMFHVRMAFSRSMSEIQVFQLRKVFHFVSLLAQSVWTILSRRVDMVCYPPANGSRWFLVARDVALLYVLRCLFPGRKFILLFHAAGLSDALQRRGSLQGLSGHFVRRALFHADAAMQTSGHNPPDGEWLQARRVHIIPNAIEDRPAAAVRTHTPGRPCRMLYVGVLSPEKGIEVLLQALANMDPGTPPWEAVLVGEFRTPAFRQSVERQVAETGIASRVHFPGVLTGDALWGAYEQADVFCFPSHADYESFGIVLLEAMMHALPVVATRWRGIQDVVQDGATGRLVPVRDPRALASALTDLLRNPSIRAQYGEAGRRRFLSEYTPGPMYDRYERMFREVARG